MDGEGYFWHAARSDDMMKVGGIRVSPVEVESTLISDVAVVECTVVANMDESNLVKPKAYVVLREGVQASDKLAKNLIDFARGEMAGCKRPRWIEFVDDLPRLQPARSSASSCADGYISPALRGPQPHVWSPIEPNETARYASSHR